MVEPVFVEFCEETLGAAPGHADAVDLAIDVARAVRRVSAIDAPAARAVTLRYGLLGERPHDGNELPAIFGTSVQVAAALVRRGHRLVAIELGIGEDVAA